MKELKNMTNGEIGYTAPWGMYKDENGQLWLRDDYLYTLKSKGTFTLKVSKENNILTVDTSLCDNKDIEYWQSGKYGFHEDKESAPLKVTE